ncbi:Enolase 1, chloroplastic [Alternaria tenuissima]|uniref:Enolase n=1 Tax=Alternaria tenuissima TaxID=119927 RepID=A0ABY0FTC3_9PLEO|nr:Enolase 1, chloroplastic [Alternaria tenuissima]
MTTILSIDASQRLDSRGNPTVQVCLRTDKGTFRSIVPSGASKGDYEAAELRDGNEKEYHGQGVLGAVENVTRVLAPQIIDKNFQLPEDVRKIDAFMIELDGTQDKGKLGANAILAISMAVWRAAASAKGVPLYQFLQQSCGTQQSYVMPVPFFNVLNGGVHSGNTMAFQEFMIAPVGADSMTEAVRMGAEVYQSLKGVIVKQYGPSAIGVGDEGGFSPPILTPHEGLDLLVTAIEASGHAGKVKIGIDPASQEFFNEKDHSYDLGFKRKSSEQGVNFDAEALAKLYYEILEQYPVVLLEDPFGQDDWPAWTSFNADCSIELVGDDLLATNRGRIEKAHQEKACNALLLKINQIGTITEAIDAAKQAYSYGWSVFVSHRSGETTDDFIADLTVGLGTGHLKSGSPCRGERVAKYNRLLDIEEELMRIGDKALYAGENFRVKHDS